MASTTPRSEANASCHKQTSLRLIDHRVEQRGLLLTVIPASLHQLPSRPSVFFMQSVWRRGARQAHAPSLGVLKARR
jgi:hypothetical protein